MVYVPRNLSLLHYYCCLISKPIWDNRVCRNSQMRISQEPFFFSLEQELLVLEEKIGTVSTALTEEALSRCLKRSNYMPASLISGFSGLDEAGAKCSICQVQSSCPDFSDTYQILFASSKFTCLWMLYFLGNNLLLLIFLLVSWHPFVPLQLCCLFHVNHKDMTYLCYTYDKLLLI